MSTDTTELESVESFRDRARHWLKENLPPIPDPPPAIHDDTQWDRARELQKILHDGGFAGICYPKQYGGQGLTPAHQAAFTDEAALYEMPLALNMPTLGICAPVILDMGTEEQKRAHLPAVIRGDELLVQFLSEPRGGSDLAGLTTRADRRGDGWIINGSKIWSSGAYAADYGLCLARTDWTVPKHPGLTMFLVPIRANGLIIQRIKQVNGWNEFCQEFFDDVEVPADAVIGEVNDGWKVASRMLFHERNSVGGGSPYFSGKHRGSGGTIHDLVEIARRTGQLDDVRVREDIGEARAMRVVSEQLIARMSNAIAIGAMPAAASSIIRLFSAETAIHQNEAASKIAGALGVTGESLAEPGLGVLGQDYLFKQAWSLAGGSTEISRNIVSERVLGMPREYAADRDVPFDQVKQGR